MDEFTNYLLESDMNLLDIVSISEGAASPENAIVTLMQHMLKYICSSKQTPSWVNSIVDSCFILAGSKVISSIIIDQLYQKAINFAEKEGNKITKVLMSRPDTWTFENLSNIEFIHQFLNDNYHAINPFDVDSLVDHKISNRNAKKNKLKRK